MIVSFWLPLFLWQNGIACGEVRRLTFLPSEWRDAMAMARPLRLRPCSPRSTPTRILPLRCSKAGLLRVGLVGPHQSKSSLWTWSRPQAGNPCLPMYVRLTKSAINESNANLHSRQLSFVGDKGIPYSTSKPQQYARWLFPVICARTRYHDVHSRPTFPHSHVTTIMSRLPLVMEGEIVKIETDSIFSSSGNLLGSPKNHSSRS